MGAYAPLLIKGKFSAHIPSSPLTEERRDDFFRLTGWVATV